VLTGGGAKGAYQIGCLRALQESGLSNIRAIAGTSVGAIHGFMLPAGKLDEAEAIWRRATFRDVAELTLKRLRFLPMWIVAAAGSEFSPFKVWRLADWIVHPVAWRRWVYPLSCIAAAVALAWIDRVVVTARIAHAVAHAFAGIFAASALLSLAHARLRPHFLGASPIAHGPLAALLDRSITEDDCVKVRATGIPVYATRSEFRPFSLESMPWGGWAPRYLRLDGMPRQALVEMLVKSSGLPGFSSPPEPGPVTIIDGAWTDNIPVAPLFFDRSLDLDLILVIILRQRIRLRPRHNSLLRVIERALQKLFAAPADQDADFRSWAVARSEAARASGLPQPLPDRLPRIVTVAPSERVGNFFTGTLRFSPEQTSRLIALGYRDMQRTLSAVVDPPVG
jgi:predicted acylesterase/phospholipase RssA